MRPRIPGATLAGVGDATDFLKLARAGSGPKAVERRDRVLIVGASGEGLTAARLARRLGADVTVIERRRRRLSRARPEDVRLARAEGVRVLFSRQLSALAGHGQVQAAFLARARIAWTARPRPIFPSGRMIKVDHVFFTLGAGGTHGAPPGRTVGARVRCFARTLRLVYHYWGAPLPRYVAAAACRSEEEIEAAKRSWAPGVWRIGGAASAPEDVAMAMAMGLAVADAILRAEPHTAGRALAEEDASGCKTTAISAHPSGSRE